VRQPLRMPTKTNKAIAREQRVTAARTQRWRAARQCRDPRHAPQCQAVTQRERTTHTLRTAIRHTKKLQDAQQREGGGASDAHVPSVERSRDAPWRTPTRRVASPCTPRHTTHSQSSDPAPAGRSGTRRHPSKSRERERGGAPRTRLPPDRAAHAQVHETCRVSVRVVRSAREPLHQRGRNGMRHWAPSPFRASVRFYWRCVCCCVRCVAVRVPRCVAALRLGTAVFRRLSASLCSVWSARDHAPPSPAARL
jgi:hypothetical protein